MLFRSYTVFIYIWNGLKASVPATANFEITKNNALLSTGTDDTIDIARLIADFVEVNPIDNAVTGALSAQATYWVKWEYTYQTTEPTDATTPQGQNGREPCSENGWMTRCNEQRNLALDRGTEWRFGETQRNLLTDNH